jgi:hypothetical protein
MNHPVAPADISEIHGANVHPPSFERFAERVWRL